MYRAHKKGVPTLLRKCAQLKSQAEIYFKNIPSFAIVLPQNLEYTARIDIDLYIYLELRNCLTEEFISQI
jgi:hypothetical protein